MAAIMCEAESRVTALESQVIDSRERGKNRDGWTFFALSVAALVPYVPALFAGFVNYDDPNYVTQNQHVRAGLTTATVVWAFKTGAAANWHPLTWLSHALDCQLYGLRPFGHHATSIFVHMLNTLLVYWGLKAFTGRWGRSAVVAALFAVHPLHVESVAWVSERKDVLSTLFGLCAMGAYLRYTRTGRARWFVGTAFGLALSLMAKPMLVTLPILLLLMDVWPLKRWKSVPAKSLVVEKVPLLVLALASSVITIYVQRAGRAWKTVDDLSLSLRMENAVVAYAAYLWKTIWPSRLSVYYPHPGGDLEWGTILVAAAVMIVVSALAWRWRTTRPYLLVGWLWYIVALLPVIGILQVGGQAMADRYTYVPLLGIFVAVVWAVAEECCENHRSRSVITVVCAVLISALGVITWRQATYWRSSESLFSHALSVTTGNYLAHSNLASTLLDQGRFKEAEGHSLSALAVRPDYVDARVNLGIALGGQGLYPESIGELRRAAEQAPERGDIYYNLGVAFVKMGNLTTAAAQFTRALQLNPADNDSRALLGRLNGAGAAN